MSIWDVISRRLSAEADEQENDQDTILTYLGNGLALTSSGGQVRVNTVTNSALGIGETLPSGIADGSSVVHIDSQPRVRVRRERTRVIDIPEYFPIVYRESFYLDGIFQGVKVFVAGLALEPIEVGFYPAYEFALTDFDQYFEPSPGEIFDGLTAAKPAGAVSPIKNIFYRFVDLIYAQPRSFSITGTGVLGDGTRFGEVHIDIGATSIPIYTGNMNTVFTIEFDYSAEGEGIAPYVNPFYWISELRLFLDSAPSSPASRWEASSISAQSGTALLEYAAHKNGEVYLGIKVLEPNTPMSWAIASTTATDQSYTPNPEITTRHYKVTRSGSVETGVPYTYENFCDQRISTLFPNVNYSNEHSYEFFPFDVIAVEPIIGATEAAEFPIYAYDAISSVDFCSTNYLGFITQLIEPITGDPTNPSVVPDISKIEIMAILPDYGANPEKNKRFTPYTP